MKNNTPRAVIRRMRKDANALAAMLPETEELEDGLAEIEDILQRLENGIDALQEMRTDGYA